MIKLTAGLCTSMLESLINEGPGAKMWICTGDIKEAEMWRLRFYRAIKDTPALLRDMLYVERVKVDEDLYEVHLHYIDESKLPKFIITRADGTTVECKTLGEKRIEKMKKEDDNLGWNKDE